MKRVIQKIAIQQAATELTIIVQGNGPLTYRLSPVDSLRLSLDLPHVVSGIRFRVLPVDHKLLKQIRIGQHPKKLRLVFDLKHPLDQGLRYAIKAVGDQLTLLLSLAAPPHP